MSAEPAPVVVVEELVAGYGGLPVLRGVSFTVMPGEVLALLGPNGAGKTTTLRAIAGVADVIDGSIALDGEVASHATHLRVRRGLGYVPDDRGIFFGLTVDENLTLASRHTPRRQRRARMDAVLDAFPALQPLRSRRAALLSGGEQQMLGLARAVLSEPHLLLIDEMSHGLAPVVVETLFPLVRELAQRLGTGVLIVEQHIRLALESADRGLVLVNGAVAMEASAGELRRDPSVIEDAYLRGAPKDLVGVGGLGPGPSGDATLTRSEEHR